MKKIILIPILLFALLGLVGIAQATCGDTDITAAYPDGMNPFVKGTACGSTDICRAPPDDGILMEFRCETATTCGYVILYQEDYPGYACADGMLISSGDETPAAPSPSQSTIYTEPYSETFTTEKELNKSVSQIKTALNVKSCNIDSNWQSKNCDYLYYCYAVLPSASTSIADSLLRECQEVTDRNSASLQIKQFIPPKGVLYYVTTFITRVNYVYDNAQTKWIPTASIPTAYINAHSIRSVCPEGQMLDFDMAAGQYKCYKAKRACLDTMKTGLCSNVYTLWVLDKNQDGTITDAELNTGANYCADRPIANYPDGDGICDMVKDLECVDECSSFDINGACTNSVPNGLCDEWDQAVNYGCWDDVLSANSKICDALDVVGCFKTYDPVCAGGRDGITYPNKCFAEKGQDLTQCSGTATTDCYTLGACEPPITQCYVNEDCPSLNVCLGGSTAGIAKLCLDYMCSYTGACGNLACNADADCAGMTMPCVGVYSECNNKVCTISGKCLTAPEPQKFNIWELIQDVWTTFWSWVRSLIG